MKNIFETHSSELGLNKEDIHERISNIEFSNATKEICFSEKDFFNTDHERFKSLGIKYINYNETEKTNIFQGNLVDIVQHDSRFLPETENYYLDNKIHSNLQKYSPTNFNEEGYNILVNFIKYYLKI